MRLRNAVPLLLLTLCLLRQQPTATAQTSGNGSITLTSIPAWGQSGLIKGKLSGVSPQSVRIYVLMFLPDTGWSDPTNCLPIIPTSNDGSFQVNLDYVAPYNNPLMFRYATRINAYAISNFSQCVQAAEAVPFFLEKNSAAQVSVPRIPQFRTIAFGGLDWYVKDAPYKVFPGPNYFVNDNAWVDNAGKLHLKVSRCGDSWCSAEVFTKERIGYGTYTFTIDSVLNTLDPNATLGLFTWDEYASDKAHREWDIEFAKWGNAASTTNAQFVVQPYTVPGNLQRFTMTSAAPSVHTVTWAPGTVSFLSSAGGTPIAQTNITSASTPIQAPGDARLHLNYYIGAGTAPTIPVDREIVIGFQYAGSPVQAGFDQTSDTTSYLGGTRSINITAGNGTCSTSVESDSAWLHVLGTGQYSVDENISAARVGHVVLHSSDCNLALGKQILTVAQDAAPCAYLFGAGSVSISGDGGELNVPITTGPACQWGPVSDSTWVVVTGGNGTGSGTVKLRVAPNPMPYIRYGTVTLPGASVTIAQSNGAACQFTLSPPGMTVSSLGAAPLASVISSSPDCNWVVSYPVPWIQGPTQVFRGSASFPLTVSPNFSASNRSAILTIAGLPFVVTQTGTATTGGTRFIPMAPCRIADTRNPAGPFGGPFLQRGSSRNFAIPAICGIPGDARAYSLNFTVVPLEGLGFLTAWPATQAQPFVSTLNSADGSIVANAAIVPAGAGGGLSVYASNATDVVIDINGYFVDANRSDSFGFYPLTPCRLVDTRNPVGPFGGPALSVTGPRDFYLAPASCGVPAAARAFSLNFTAVPKGPLAYLSAWPTGQSQPAVSTLNSPQGRVLANAAIVPAGTASGVTVFALSDAPTPTDVVIDINGHFASPGGLSFYPVTPCRAVDTRPGQGKSGEFGPPSLAKGTTRVFTLPGSGCGIPAGAAAYSLNVTVVPGGPLSYLTIWPAGAGQPFVSTLNSPDGRVLANAAIVPAGTNGAVSVYVLTQDVPCDVVIDVNGYFAP